MDVVRIVCKTFTTINPHKCFIIYKYDHLFKTLALFYTRSESQCTLIKITKHTHIHIIFINIHTSNLDL